MSSSTSLRCFLLELSSASRSGNHRASVNLMRCRRLEGVTTSPRAHFLSRVSNKLRSQARRRFYSSRVVASLASFFGLRVIHCLGDSHIEVFWRIKLPHTHFRVVSVGGATALGIANPLSQTNALRIFRALLKTLSPGAEVVVMLGEVDCACLLFLFAQNGHDIDQLFDRSLNNLCGFVKEVQAHGHRVIAIAVPPQIIEDYSDWNNPGSLRLQVRATWEERMKITRLYNERLQIWAAANDCPVVNVESDVIDPLTSRVAVWFRRADPDDIHYADDRLGPLLGQRLSELLPQD
jgi:hypothetical protein